MKDDTYLEARARLFAGLYDAPSDSGPDVSSRPLRAGVRLLNPTTTDDDATARRFAFLEID